MQSKYTPGQKFRARIPFGNDMKTEIYSMVVHIMYVLPSTYDDEMLIIYKVFGTHKQWWHEIMCTERQMDSYVEIYQDCLNRNKENGK